MTGRIPARKRHLAKARLTSERPRPRQGSSSTPRHRQQMRVSTYLLPPRSAGVDEPSKSMMTSFQQSKSGLRTHSVSRAVGRLRKRWQARHVLTHDA
eukprot:6649960-Alexandrium_andersonii.AAC.1